MIAAVVSIAMMAFATPAGADDSHAYSAKQIFEGVFFGQGPVAHRLPEIWNSYSLAPYRGKVRSAEFGNALGALEGKIEKHDPTYFAQLQRDMTSGDPGLVQHAVQVTHSEIAAVTPSGASHLSAHPFAESQSKDGDAEDTVVVLLLVFVLVVVLETSGGCTGINCPAITATRFNDDRAAALIASRLRS